MSRPDHARGEGRAVRGLTKNVADEDGHELTGGNMD
jgi:hypothetical protein